MSYKNGKEVLPHSLLKELQKYIQGELIYIPKRSSQRAGWGENNGSRELIARRNEDIYRLYTEGRTLEELEHEYSLSADSIRKIIYKTRSMYSEMK